MSEEKEKEKKKISMKKVLLIAFLIWLAVKVFFAFIRGANNELDKKLPPTAIESYYKGCVSSGGSEGYCVCTRDYLKNKYGEKVFSEPINAVLSKAQEARKNCSN